MVWPVFPLQFHNPERGLQHPSVHIGCKSMMQCQMYYPFLDRFSGFFEKKLASLKFATASGLSFSFCTGTMHASTPPVHSSLSMPGLLILANRLPSHSLCASGLPNCILACTGGHVHIFQLAEFENLLAYQLDNCLILSIVVFGFQMA